MQTEGYMCAHSDNYKIERLERALAVANAQAERNRRTTIQLRTSLLRLSDERNELLERVEQLEAEVETLDELYKKYKT